MKVVLSLWDADEAQFASLLFSGSHLHVVEQGVAHLLHEEMKQNETEVLFHINHIVNESQCHSKVFIKKEIYIEHQNILTAVHAQD